MTFWTLCALGLCLAGARADDNRLPGAGLAAEDPTCERLEEDVARADRHTVARDPPRLAGTWVSEGCETRPGPEYVLRSYTFYRNHSFRLLLARYQGEWCASPQHTLAARGRLRLRGRSWLVPGALEAEYELRRVTVTAHSEAAAADLARRLNATCPGSARRRWRPHREYLVLAGGGARPPHRDNTLQGRLQRQEEEEIDCLSALNTVFHELQLLRVHIRPAGPPDYRHPRHELLLGDMHSRPEMGGQYRPTAFQVPLLKADQAQWCAVCQAVARAGETAPPHLHARPRLPVLRSYLAGDWVSSRCETRPLGTFLRRRLRLGSGPAWRGEYRFFADPACALPVFSAVATGSYAPLADSLFEFRVERVSLAVLDPGAARALRCGGDLTPAGGCPALGLVVPSVEYETVRIDVDPQGASLLLVGQPDTDGRRRGPGDGATAYQLPLVQCRPQQDNQLYPVPLRMSGGGQLAGASLAWLLALCWLLL
ncbi:protein APCDD1-like [Bacillus rossius redtenbacheri]|uniref:protein APCDD1-like n=1 Tax=Bacillus rossius redtenbacheri TaxID=93214 RepID=UPI002FDCC94D